MPSLANASLATSIADESLGRSLSEVPLSMGITAWWRADAGIDNAAAISEHVSIVGGFTLTQTTPSLQPPAAPDSKFNNEPSIFYLSSDHLLMTGASALVNGGAADHTLVACLSIEVFSTDRYIHGFGDSTDSGFNFTNLQGTSGDVRYSGRPDGGGTQHKDLGSAPASDTAHVIIATYNSSTGATTVRLNNTESSFTFSPLLDTKDTYAVGGLYVAGSLVQGTQGYVAEHGVFDRVLDATERQQYADYCFDRYGITP